MFSILKICLSILVCLTGGSFSNAAFNLRQAAYAPNIIHITSDSLILVAGFTRQFSVDSPEVQQPVSTGIAFRKLAEQLILNSYSVLWESRNTFQHDHPEAFLYKMVRNAKSELYP